MNYYVKLIQGVSGYIAKELKLNETDKDKIRFGMEILVSTCLSLFCSLLLARLLGISYSVIFVLLAGAILKQFSGGIHLKTIWECAFFTAIFSNLLGLISLWAEELIYNNWIIFLIISYMYIFVSLYLWSPAEVAENPIKNEKQRRSLRRISLVVVSSLLVLTTFLFCFYKDKCTLFNISITLGLLLQTSTINPLAYYLDDLYYQIK